MKILLCFGTRPEAIKMAPVIYELQKQKMDFEVCVTAQHREMLDQVLDFFEIVPNYDLNLMKPGQNLNLLSAKVLEGMDQVLEKSKPDWVLLQGDTTTAFIVSLAAFNRGIKTAHIEAGLRTGNLCSPFPEEANRQLISRIADIHFIPTVSAGTNLLKESIAKKKIFLTGNTVVDALNMGIGKLEKKYVNKEIENLQGMLQKGKKLILVTGHRRENFGRGMESVCEALVKISKRNEVQIIFPVHLNPGVKQTVYCLLGKKPGIHLLEPLNYPAFLWLMRQADLIISDSGGIQEEAPSLKKPVIVTRLSTERIEALEIGYSYLAGTSKEKIIELTEKILKNPPDYSGLENPYGNGLASKKIVEALKNMNI